MKELLKEIGLYILIAVVLANLTVNIIQNDYDNCIIGGLEAITDKLVGTTESIYLNIDRINKAMIIQDNFNRRSRQDLSKTINIVENSTKQNSDILNNQQKLMEQHQTDIDSLNKITRPQKEPDVEKLLSATVEITTLSSGGAGVCINEDNNYYYILTAQHVVMPRLGNVVSIRMRDKLIYAGEILKEDPDVDLALVRVRKWEDTYLPIVKLANKEPKVKDRVFAVGHPLGTYWTITEGIISNLNAESYLMTTATVTFGNSGGALFNTDGDIIGICSKVYAYTMISPESSMGLAIRLSLIREFIEVK